MAPNGHDPNDEVRQGAEERGAQDDATEDRGDGFVVHATAPLNGGPTPQAQRASFVTPNHLFFVRTHGEVPRIDPDDYVLRIEGLVERPLSLTLAHLARFERTSVLSTLVCAGQRRSELLEVAPVPGELPWNAEAVSTARWEGWRLCDVLAAAGLREGAGHVASEGHNRVEHDGERFRFGTSIPLAKAMAPEVLLADTMNGAPLPREHGAPLRLVVPGYIGARQVKWLRRIEVRAAPSDNYFQAKAYRLYPSGQGDEPDPASGFALGEASVNCLICEPADGSRVDADRVTVRGYAYGGGGRSIVRVEVSVDGGQRWTLARFDDVAVDGTPHVAGDPFAGRFAWRFFSADVTCPPGDRFEVVARAWDEAANTQPASTREVWNVKGYMNNAWSRVRLTRR